MEFKRLFWEKSSSVYSPAFTVIPNSIMVISAYGFGNKITREDNQPTTNQTMAIVQKMSFEGGGIFSEACNCDSLDPALLGFEPEFSYVEDVTQCGLWNLNACQNTGIIILPGTYRLRLNDPGAPGHVYVHITAYMRSELFQIPSGLIFGE